MRTNIAAHKAKYTALHHSGNIYDISPSRAARNSICETPLCAASSAFDITLSDFYVDELSDTVVLARYKAFIKNLNRLCLRELDQKGVLNNDTFIEHFSRRDDIPDEHRICAYPDTEKMNMRDRVAMYGGMTSKVHTIDKTPPTLEERV